ncbi:MAG: hypothetical protein KME31_05935 [Tolypothrix carrinoi HA7290-LM1]|nr:hypothetical protein [Tolypothrix carrinoi HA7290-LM1]
MGETTAGASSRETRRQVLQRGEPPQRTASPTHCLPLALASPFGRRPRWLTTNQDRLFMPIDLRNIAYEQNRSTPIKL